MRIGADARGERPRKWLSRGVGAIGASSLFSDTGHEIATSLLPGFLTSVLHASASALGIIEGLSDALMGIAKLVTGPLANEPRRRGQLASSGYLGTAVATGAIGVTVAVWQVGALRALAWFSRGLRSPARDSLLASLAPRDSYGRAFGLERAGDNLGAVAGPLLAALLVREVGIRPAIWMAAVPGALAAITITAAAREARSRLHSVPIGEGAAAPARFRDGIRVLGEARLLRAFLPISAFELGNMATTLLILRATQLLHTGGRSLVAATSLAILVYAGHNAVASATSLGGGRWIDRVGPRLVFAVGAACYVLAYAGFAAGPASWSLLLVVFGLAGAGIGFAETAESALVARLSADRVRGTAFGLLGGVQAAGGLGSSVAVGLLYSTASPRVAFGYAAGWMAVSLAGSLSLTTGRP